MGERRISFSNLADHEFGQWILLFEFHDCSLSYRTHVVLGQLIFQKHLLWNILSNAARFHSSIIYCFLTKKRFPQAISYIFSFLGCFSHFLFWFTDITVSQKPCTTPSNSPQVCLSPTLAFSNVGTVSDGVTWVTLLLPYSLSLNVSPNTDARPPKRESSSRFAVISCEPLFS